MYVLGMYIYIYMYLFIETHRETCIYVHKVTYTSNSSRYFAQQRIIPRGICIYNVLPPKRTVPPSLTDEFAAAHDAAISCCLAVLLAGATSPLTPPPSASSGRSCMGGLGLSSASEHRHAAYWAFWADVIGALRECHPGTLANLVRPFTIPSLTRRPARQRPSTPLRPSAFRASKLQRGRLSLAGPLEGDDDPSLKVRRGWQRSAGAAVDKRVFEVLFADLDSASRALLPPLAAAPSGCPLAQFPTTSLSAKQKPERQQVVLYLVHELSSRPQLANPLHATGCPQLAVSSSRPLHKFSSLTLFAHARADWNKKHQKTALARACHSALPACRCASRRKTQPQLTA